MTIVRGTDYWPLRATYVDREDYRSRALTSLLSNDSRMSLIHDLLWMCLGLGLMQAEWATLSSSVRLSLKRDIEKISYLTSDTQLVNIISGLSKMNAQWHSFPSSFIESLESRLIQLLPSMNDRHLSSLAFSFASLGLFWSDIKSPIRDLMSSRYEQILSTGTSSSLLPTISPSTDHNITIQGFSILLSSLAKLHFKWTYFYGNLEAKIYMALSRLLSDLDGSQLSSIISSMARMSFRWENFPSQLQGKILNKIRNLSTNYPNLSCKDKSQLISGFGSLGLVWERLKEPVEEELMLWTQHISSSGSFSELSGLIFGLGHMECSWERLPKDIRSTMAQSILSLCDEMLHIDSYRSNKTVSGVKPWGYSSIGRRWMYVSSASTILSASGSNSNITSSSMKRNCQAIANLMYGLSLMIFDITIDPHCYKLLYDVYLKLSEVVSQIGISSFSIVEREQILIYIHLMDTYIHTNTYTKTLNISDETCLSSKYIIDSYQPTNYHSHSISKLQQSIGSAISSALAKYDEKLEVIDEYSAFGGIFPVDVTIFEGNDPVAFVEVDGPHHFKSSGLLRRKDLMKEALYKCKHPCASFTRVRYDQVNRLGSQFVGNEITNFITCIRKHRTCNLSCDNLNLEDNINLKHMKYSLAEFPNSIRSNGMRSNECNLQAMASNPQCLSSSCDNPLYAFNNNGCCLCDYKKTAEYQLQTALEGKMSEEDSSYKQYSQLFDLEKISTEEDFS